MNKQRLDTRERKLVAGFVAGKSLTQAAKDAGYAKSTAEKKAFAILRRPLVRSELTKGLEACGVKYKDFMQPIADALKATTSYVHPKIGMMDSKLPDHAIRLAAADRAIKLLGGIPKVGESTPSASGLNLFITVDSEHRPPA